jgi:hypothetical protein
MFEIQNRTAQRYIFSPIKSIEESLQRKLEEILNIVSITFLKTVQVNFVVNTVLIQYCVYYEIYLNSLYFMNGIEMFIKLAFLMKERERKKDLATLLPYKVKESRQ